MGNRKNVVIISDCKGVAYNEMKRVLLNECTKLGCEEIDVELVEVAEFSIINAAFLTRLMVDHYPPGTVFSVVINPQKQRSARIYGRTSEGYLFFGANTGALTWLIKDFGVEELYEIYDPGFVPFGGKYVHAPNVAKLVAGIPLDKFGKKFPLDSLTKLDLKEGTVVHIDNFGLVKIKGKTPNYKEGTALKVEINGKKTIKATFAKRMMSRDDKEWVLYPGSSLDSMPELGTVRYTDGFEEVGIKIGDIITWEPFA